MLSIEGQLELEKIKGKGLENNLMESNSKAEKFLEENESLRKETGSLRQENEQLSRQVEKLTQQVNGETMPTNSNGEAENKTEPAANSQSCSDGFQLTTELAKNLLRILDMSRDPPVQVSL